jgi:hypothetical protein
VYYFLQHIEEVDFHFYRLLLRVRLLYYLRQEVIGPEAEKVLSGAPARYILLFESL